jgi:hypothetical protein
LDKLKSDCWLERKSQYTQEARTLKEFGEVSEINFGSHRTIIPKPEKSDNRPCPRGDDRRLKNATGSAPGSHAGSQSTTKQLG